jgi:hypothetical protein
MPRTLKKTRIKGLPPRVLLSRRQDATGSFPTVWRTASDNRTGKYSVFYNADKEVPFGYQANPVLANSTSFSTKYEEQEVKLSTPDPPGVIAEVVTFVTSFDAVPVVVITDINHDVNVNAYLTNVTKTGFSVAFSDYWSGSFVYRAFENTDGEPRHVKRGPRYPTTYAQVISKTGHMGSSSNNFSFTINNSVDPHIYDVFPTEHYITFIDPTTPNYLADISASATVNGYTVAATATDVANNDYNYIGFKPITAPTGMVYPIMLTPTAISASLSPEDAADMVGELVTPITKQIVASGAMKRGVSDTFVTFTPGQNLQSFRDFANPAVDNKLFSSSLGGINPSHAFYATGSAVDVAGIGFQQPLWSKSKIEIDLTPATNQTISAYSQVPGGPSYPMSYWNPSKKVYEGIGTGKPIFDSYTIDLNGVKNCLAEQTFGFAASYDFYGGVTIDTDSFNVYGRQIETFGFPYHQKFQPTSSQQISMQDYISEPFLLEKIVLELSSSLFYTCLFPTNSSIWTFFILNSRNNIPNQQIGSHEQSHDYPFGSSFVTSSISNGYYCDLVDYLQVAFTGSVGPLTPGFPYNNEYKAADREAYVTPINLDNVNGTFGYQSQFVISSSVKSSLLFEDGPWTSIGFNQTLLSSGRNQILPANGRDWINTFEKTNVLKTVTTFHSYKVNDEYTKTNPYILLPTDKLTFGCQLPWPMFAESLTSSIAFSPQGINKITLYGSSLRLNPETNQLEEYHDTLNQLLSSESIHENLG